MKKPLVTISVLLPLLLGGAPVLFESFQTEPFTTSKDHRCDIAVVELSFSVDTGCYTLLSTGGQARLGSIFLKLDDTKLSPRMYCSSSEIITIPMTYTTYLEPGNHTVTLWMETYNGSFVEKDPCCNNSYIQALLFLPDTAVIEAVQGNPFSSDEVGKRNSTW